MWDEVYADQDYVYGTLPNDFLKEHYSAIPKGNIICLAGGEGRNAVFLAKQGYDVTVVDISSVALDKAKKLAYENNVSINCIVTDLAQFDLGENKWDGVVSIFCHLPSTIRQALYQRVEMGLKKDGVFLLEGYTPEQLKNKTGGPPVEDMMLSETILTHELPNLTFKHLSELVRDVVEGYKHTGEAAVVQAIGYKI